MSEEDDITKEIDVSAFQKGRTMQEKIRELISDAISATEQAGKSLNGAVALLKEALRLAESEDA